jgi:hypothetical protein
MLTTHVSVMHAPVVSHVAAVAVVEGVAQRHAQEIQSPGGHYDWSAHVFETLASKLTGGLVRRQCGCSPAWLVSRNVWTRMLS